MEKRLLNLEDGGDGGAFRACDSFDLVHRRLIKIAEVFSIFNPPILVFGDSFLTIHATEIHLRVVTFDSARTSLQRREEDTEKRFRKNHCYVTIQFLVV